MKKNRVIIGIFVFVMLSGLLPASARGAGPPIPAGVKPAIVTNAGRDFAIQIYDEKYNTYTLESKEGKIEIAPGKYILSYVYLRKKDKSGRSWQLMSAYQNRSITMEQGGTVELDFNEPLNVRIVKDGDYFAYEIHDNKNNQYTTTLIDGKTGKPFMFVIEGPDGKKLDSGQFQPG